MKQIQVNAWAPFVLSREFARRVSRGKIVNLLDTRIAGHERTHAAYLLSKKMLASSRRMCALEFAPGITVNAVAPGAILPPAGKGPEYLEELAKRLPLKRHGGPQDIVDAVLYLLEQRFRDRPDPVRGRRKTSSRGGPMDRILIQDLLVRCIIGVNEDERHQKQDVVINLTLTADLSKAGKSDRFEDTVDYRAIKKQVMALAENSQFHLIEALAEAIAALCLRNSG